MELMHRDVDTDHGQPGSRRLWHVAALLGTWTIVIVARLVQLQVVQHDEFIRQAQQQQERSVELQASRGTVFDRTGQPLAMSTPAPSICVNPLRLKDLEFAANLLSRTLHLDERALRAKLNWYQHNQKGFMWVKRKLPYEEAAALRSMNLEWVEIRDESQRFYPNGPLAVHVVGSVDGDQKGNAGIEQGLDLELQGQSGMLRVVSDVKQRRLESEVTAPMQQGQDLQLTIDHRLQYVAEQALAKAVEAHHCKAGSLVAMNPYTGEILALANYPSYDPNRKPKPGEEELGRANQAVQVPFEPGSVFKVITLTAALETTNLRPQSIINCGNGTIRLPGRIVHDHNSYSALPMEDVLAKSSNIGAINVGIRVGNAKLLEYVKRFGFGKRTGLPLPGESSGIVYELKRWQPASIGSVAMGHEVSTTTVQLARACSVVANGGMLVKPRLIKPKPGEKVDLGERVIRPQTALTMRQMMEHVVLAGTGKKAKLEGYTSGGKTGTAQIYDLSTHQYTHKYNASFMGFAPVTKPEIVVVVTVNGATGTAGYGGEASAPVFREVAQMALRLMEVPKDLPDEPLKTVPAAPEPAEALNDLSIAGLVGPPLPQGPPTPEQESHEVAGPKVPNFQGKTLKAVLRESAASGLPVQFSGSGLVRGQFPPPGAILPPGDKVKVIFNR